MKRLILPIMFALLSGCVSDVSEESVFSSSSETKTVARNASATTASYMTDQENELQQAVSNTSFQIVREGNILTIVLPEENFFSLTDDNPDSVEQNALKKIADILSRYDRTRINIIGYINSGQPLSDGKISEKRAMAVASILKNAAKIENVRFWVEGSNIEPIASFQTDDVRIKNNHVDIILTPTFIQ